MVVCWVCVEGGEQAQEDSGAQPGEEVPEFDADWGLETLVNVGEHWIDSLLQVLLEPFQDQQTKCSFVNEARRAMVHHCCKELLDN